MLTVSSKWIYSIWRSCDRASW